MDHPSVVRYGELLQEPGYLAMVVELVYGTPLDQVLSSPRLHNHHREAILLQLTSALAHIHGARTVHRDLKPENVILGDHFWDDPDRAGSIKLIDFGLAVKAGNPDPLTSVNKIVGTLPFIAPESIDRDFFGEPEATPRADLFALGVLGWLLLGDELPSGSREPDGVEGYGEVYRKAARKPKKWPRSKLDHRWASLFRRCLSVHASERPASAV